MSRLTTLLVSSFIALSPAVAHAQAVGKTDKVEVGANAENAGQTRPLEAGSYIIFNDVLTTGPGARLQATLQDGTGLTLGENGSLTVDEFVYDPAKNVGYLDIDVTKGAFLFVGGDIEHKDGAYVAINTPVATLGVRGTTVWGGAIDGGYGVLVLDGEVEVKTKRGKVALKAGEGTMIYGAKKPEAAAPWPEDRTKRAVASISFTEPKPAE